LLTRALRRLPLLSLIAVLALGVTSSLQAALEEGVADDYDCPLLDSPERARSYAGLEAGYVFPAETSVATWEKMAVIEVGTWGGLIYAKNDWGGDFEVRAHGDSMILQNYDGLDSGYPLTSVRLFTQWSQRFVHGYGLQLDASPGLYSALESFTGDDFAVPFGFTAIKAFSEHTAVFAGLTAYPTFEQVVDPRLGLRLTSKDIVTFDLAYPETKLVVGRQDGLRLVGGARMMLWPQYNMGDDPREFLRYREARAYGGLSWGRSGSTEISLQGGYTFGRQLSFGDDSPDVDIEDAPFVKLGLTYLL
jgi:hypothetical protein